MVAVVPTNKPRMLGSPMAFLEAIDEWERRMFRVPMSGPVRTAVIFTVDS